MNKKIGLIIGIVLFIGALVAIAVIYNKNDKKQEELVDEAVSLGIVKVNDDNYEEEVLKSDKVVVLDFYENMCPPCTSMIPTIINISKSSEDVKVVMINMSDSDTKKLAAMHEVSATPTIVIMSNGEVKKKIVGATSEESIMSVVNKQLESKNEK